MTVPATPGLPVCPNKPSELISQSVYFLLIINSCLIPFLLYITAHYETGRFWRGRMICPWNLAFAKFHHSAQNGMRQFCRSGAKRTYWKACAGGTGTRVRTCVGVIVSAERASLLQSRWLFWCPIGSFFVAIKPSFTAVKQIASPKMTPVVNQSLWACSVWAAHSGERCARVYEVRTSLWACSVWAAHSGERCARSEVCAQTCLLARVNLCSVTDEAKQYFVTILLW